MEVYTVERGLKNVALRAKLFLIVYGIFKLCVFVLLFSLATFVIDFYIPDIPGYVRLIMLFIGIGLLLRLIYKHIIKIVLWKPTSSYLAGVVENYFKDLNDVLISAVDFAKKVASGYKKESQEMMIEVIKVAIKEMKERIVTKVITVKPLIRTYLYGLISIGAVFYLTHTFKDYSKIWLCRIRGGSCKWPQKFSLELFEPQVKPHTNIVNVGLGDRLRIIARAKGVVPSKVLLSLLHPDNRQEYFYMNRLLADENKDKFIYELTNITKDFSFFFKSGEIESSVYKVETFPYPTIENLTYKIKYPPYTGRSAEERTGTGDLDNVPIGSTVEIHLTSNVQLNHGIVEFESLAETDKDKKKILYPSYLDGYYKLSGEFLAKKSSDFSITLFARDNPQIKNKEHYMFSLKITEDLPPLLKIHYPEKGTKYLTPVGKLPMKIEGIDDYGIKHFAMRVKKIDGEKIEEFIKKIHIKKREKNRMQKVIAIEAKNFKAKVGNSLEINFSLWDTCNFQDKDLNKAMQCPHKVNTETALTKRISVISIEEFENHVEARILELKEKIDGIIKKQEILLNDVKKLKGHKIQDALIYEFIFRMEGVINDTSGKIRNELKDIYLDIINNKLYPDNKVIPQKLKEAYGYANTLVDAKYHNKGLLFDILRDIRVINEEDKVNEVITNIDNSILIYNHILNILEQWESYQDVVRIIKQIKDKQEEVKKILKQEKQE
ncbi:MAG: hypothetical protein ACK4NF_01750 [Planctomycetota bacterium]